MKTLIRISFAGILLLAHTSHAQWVQTSNGIYGGCINAIAISGSNMFAATRSDGVFLSTNNGTSWTQVNSGLTTMDISSLAISGTNLFAGSDDSVFLSTNNGSSWSGANVPFSRLTRMVQSGSDLFALTSGGIHLSTSNGASWTKIDSGLSGKNVTSLAVSPNGTSGTNIFAGTFNGIFLSTNNGISWTEADSGLIEKRVIRLAFAGPNLFAVTFGPYVEGSIGIEEYSAGSGLVFLSTDNGSSWKEANVPFSSFDQMVQSGSNTFAGTWEEGVFLSTNNGASWTGVDSGFTAKHVTCLAISASGAGQGLPKGSSTDSTNGANIFAGTEGRGVFLSTNNGTNWSPVNTGMAAVKVSAFVVSSNGSGGTDIFAGTAESGIYRSSNNGESWTDANNGLIENNISCLAVSTTGEGQGLRKESSFGSSSGVAIFAGTRGGGVFVSTNNGTSWSAVNNGIPEAWLSTEYREINAIAISGKNLFAGTSGDQGSPGSIVLSTDDGTSWTDVSSGIPLRRTCYLETIAVSDTNLFAATGAGIYLSTDSGTNWSGANSGLPKMSTPYDTNYVWVQSLAVTPIGAGGANLFASPDSGVYRSTNNGTNWMPANTPFSFFTNMVGVGTYLFAGTENGVFLTSNNGGTWNAVITGLTTPLGSVDALAVSGSDLFAAFGNGVWRRPLSEMIPSGSTDSLLVPVAGGTFTAGTTPVTISSFNIDKYEVTYELWTAVRTWAVTHGYTDLVAGQNGCNPVGTNNPVTMVNWYDIVKWCNARSEKDGLTPVYYTRSVQDTIYRTGELDINIDAVKWIANGYRLPTEAEWEFAARGGNQTNNYTYSGSNTIDSVAWSATNSGYTTHTVGTRKANELGIYDMSGNAWEWCWDWYGSAYPSGGTTDPKGPSTTQTNRVLRGGSCDRYSNNNSHNEYFCRVDGRGCSCSPYDRGDNHGFRCTQGSQVGTAVKGETSMPQTFGLAQNYPNPFNPETVVRYQVSGIRGQSSRQKDGGQAVVSVKIYDLLGREVAVLVNEEKLPGTYSVQWNASAYASGMYFYRLEANGRTETRKMLLVR